MTRRQLTAGTKICGHLRRGAFAVVLGFSGLLIATHVAFAQAAGRGTGGQPNVLWQGRIEVDNRFEGRTLAMDVHGRHNWRSTYLVKFLETWTDTFVSDLSGRRFYLNKFIPLELKYTIRANHHHDYDHKWGDVVMRGQAAGTMTGDELQFAGRKVLLGELLRFETPGSAAIASGTPSSHSFASWREFQEFVTRFETSRREVCYQLSIGFIIGQLPAERRALYQGINRSGSSPIHPDPDQDFLRVMPAFMPDGTNVYDCLGARDQQEARGQYSFPFPDPGPLDSTAMITIRWSFIRCREGRACVQVVPRG